MTTRVHPGSPKKKPYVCDTVASRAAAAGIGLLDKACGFTLTNVNGDDLFQSAMRRALFIGPIDDRASNGMTQHQATLLAEMARLFDHLDVLSLFASPRRAKAWIERWGVRAAVLHGPFAHAARANALLWQAAGTLLACKLGWTAHFPFLVTTPLPHGMARRYDRIFCYYPWGVILLGLDRFGDAVSVNLGDVMAERHARIGMRRWISLSRRDEQRVVYTPIRNAAISQFDADEFSRLYDVVLPVIPSVPPHHGDLVALASTARPRAAGFFASGANAINIATLSAIAAPKFLETLRAAGIGFVLGGSICQDAPEAVLAALKAGGAQLLGRVASPVEFYRAIGAMVAPVGPSSGLKMKSVETLLSGRGLITTRWGSDAVFDGFAGQVFVLDWPPDPGVMARAVIAALADTTSDRSAAAQRYVDGALGAFERSLC